MPERLPIQPWMQEASTQALIAALNQAGIMARFVGGCVRDALLGLEIGDIDIATPATPEQVTSALEKAGIKVVPTGIAHGTVTAVIPPRHFEITTLRRDVETFGRHARVAFDADWAEDAARRDFTINALYLDPDGTLHDPVGGLADLAARRVRFVGEARRRIAEDVLRVLRYYRFEARFGTGEGDPEGRAACRESAPLLPNLSVERVAHELLRLLQVSDPVRPLRMMHDDGVLAVLLPEATRLDRLDRLIEIAPQPDALLRLAALIDADAAGAAALAERLRLSNTMRDHLAGLAAPYPLDPNGDERAQRRAIYCLGAERYKDIARLVAADARMPMGFLTELIGYADAWPPPQFPLTGRDVTALGVPPGPLVGQLLEAVRDWWEDADFARDRSACLVQLSACLVQLRELIDVIPGPEHGSGTRDP